MNGPQRTAFLSKGYISEKVQGVCWSPTHSWLHLCEQEMANLSLAGSQNLCQTIKQHCMGGG